ncbi:glycosyltransferase [Solirhodobacter olei]|uniref:glycosyltransferase n=1 Tax=Solirhodobacter olei TaxID=2493082 RepID=UPI001F4E3651|nr:glycosyltransferase family 2 protein [Solirhodobacter olei]
MTDLAANSFDTPAVSAASTAPAAPALTVVVPTYNERENVRPMVKRLAVALEGIAWEVVFVDDDSPDGTAREVRAVARQDARVRLHQRIGRRGLAGACIEGILSSVAPLVAVIDADLQHDEGLLPRMFRALESDPELQLVIGSRRVASGSNGSGLSRLRAWGSGRANGVARRLLGIEAQDPMSGFFMVRRGAFNEVVLDLQKQGFKILADMLSASGGRWRVLELPYTFRPRVAGESKLDGAVTLEFLGLLLARLTGGLLPIRFILFLMVGATGVVIQLSVVRAAMALAGEGFVVAQPMGVLVAMTTNYMLNNAVTWRDRRLRGRAFLRGLFSFYAVCALGAVANIGTADATYSMLNSWIAASLAGAGIGALWNFWASLIVTWRAR